MLAARKLGIHKIPCIRLGHLTELQKRAYIIADNKLALNSGWDEQMLGIELSDLRENDFDLDILGFDASAIETFLNPEAIVNNPDDEWNGMPEFDQQDNGSFKSINVHFLTNDDYLEFSKAINQKLTDKTKSIWFPKRDQDQCNRDFNYDSAEQNES